MSTTIIADHHNNGQGDPLPPHDLSAEQSVLGAMLISADAIGEVAAILTGTDRDKSADFYQPKHATIYRVILDLFNAGDPVDPVTVGAELATRGEFARVGGTDYLLSLVRTVPTAANADYYADIVAKQAARRHVAEAGTRIAQYGYGAAGDLDVDQLLNRAQAQLDAITDGRVASRGDGFFGDRLDSVLSNLDDVQAGRIPPGVASGLTDLDSFTDGFKPGQLVVIAARPGIGKSALALGFVRQAAIRDQRTTLVFSLEMSFDELALRVLSSETGIPLATLNKPGEMGLSDWDRIHAKREELSAIPLVIDASPNITMTEIRTKARRVKSSAGLDLIVLDYLQLMTGSARAESRQLEVAEFSRSLKLLAKELEVPVIVLSQLNRGPEQRTDKRPMLSDLRESGAIEADADLVVLLSRPDAYDPDDPRAGEVDLIIAKNRSGPTGTVTVANRLHVGEFRGFAPEDQGQGTGR